MKNLKILVTALAISFSSAYATDAPGTANDILSPTHPLKGVIPSALKIEDKTAKKEFCASIVEIIDAKKACTTSKCLRPFSYDSKESTQPKAGIRAISVASCDPQKKSDSFLLWGPENLLILKPDRKLEKDLWEAAPSKKTKAITFTTEAGSGTLTLKSGKFTWTESE
ncbi:MAG: hypothetical protein RJB60_129 [Pseudomonadota bacterium]|jgi:hypothetical protein